MSSNSVWEANLRIIEAQYPGLAAQLLQSDEGLSEADVRVERAASGDPTLIVRGIHAHSPRDPVREARRLAENAEGDGPAVLLGFGLGYAAEALAGAAPNRPVVVVERRPLILKKALESRDLGAFLSQGRVLFVLGDAPKAVAGALRLLEDAKGGTGKIALIRNRALTGLDEDWYAQAERCVNAWTAREDVNAATLRRFGKRWVRNLAQNRQAVRDLPGISRLAGCLAPLRVPALLVAAGPSLDDIAPLLPELARRAVIVAADTSLRLLLERGVDPDFAVSVDPQYWNARHLDRAPVRRTCLVAESAAYPSVLRAPFARAFLCASLFPLGRFIEDRLDPKGSLGAGGSVATTAWDFARTLGPSGIWVAGLDLSFPGLKTHFQGALFEARSLAESHRLKPAETWSVRALRDGRPFHAPSTSGGQVLTDSRLSLYAAWFEAQFRRHPQAQTRSLSPKGLAIPGFPASPVEELLALPPRRAEIDRLLADTYASVDEAFNAPAERESRSLRYEAARAALLRGLETLQALAAESADLAAKAAASRTNASPADRDRVLRRLGEANQSIMASEVKDVAGFLFPPMADLEAALATPESDAYGRYLELSAGLYQSLAETTGYHLEILGKE